MINIAWEHFTPWSAVFGGMVIGLSATIFLLFNGRIAGISGILGGLFRPMPGDILWRILFFTRPYLLTLGVASDCQNAAPEINASYPTLILAGLLVGVGTRFGSGCTSGHGVCGLSRLSKRSLFATLSFMGAGFMMTYVVRHAFGG